MARLVEVVRTLVDQSLDDHHVVVWYDAAGSLAPIAAQLAGEGRRVLTYDGSFLALRVAFEESDPALREKTVLYVGRERPEPSWLRDLELGGACLRLGLGEALGSGLGISTSARQREQLAGPVGSLLASRWDELVPNGASMLDLSLAMLAAVLQLDAHADLRSLVLAYVTRDDAHREVESVGLQGELAELLAVRAGLSGLPEGEVPPGRLAAALLLSEAASTGGLETEGLGEALPDDARRAMWVSWAKEWMLREDAAAFLRWSKRVGELYRVPHRLTGPTPSVAKINAFAAAEDVCLARAESLVEHDSLEEARSVALARVDSRWAKREEAQGRPSPWRVVLAAVDLLQGAAAAVVTLDGRGAWPLPDLLVHYFNGWWRLDDAYRRLEAGWTTASRTFTERAVVSAARSYAGFLDKLAFAVSDAVASARVWAADGWKSQRDVVAAFVDGEQRTALVLADALRLDLARIVAGRLRQSSVEVEEVKTLAALPSVTEVGMAAIQVPGWDERALSIEGRSIAPVVGGTRLRGRDDRLSAFRGRFSAADAIELDAVNQHHAVPDAHPLVVFARAIDEQGDNLPDVQLDLFERLAGRMADAVLRLLDEGYARVLIVPDHGFVLSPKGIAVPTVPAPTADAFTVRKHRYATGRPSDVDGAVRIPLRALGWNSEGDALFPRGRGVFSLPGEAPRFFHGGPLPQEVALASLVCRRAPSALPKTGVAVVEPSQIVTTIPRFVLRGESDSLSTSRRVRLLVRSEDRVVGESEPVELAAGDERALTVRLERYGPEAYVTVEDLETREVVAERVIPVELPPGYEDLDL